MTCPGDRVSPGRPASNKLAAMNHRLRRSYQRHPAHRIGPSRSDCNWRTRKFRLLLLNIGLPPSDSPPRARRRPLPVVQVNRMSVWHVDYGLVLAATSCAVMVLSSCGGGTADPRSQ